MGKEATSERKSIMLTVDTHSRLTIIAKKFKLTADEVINCAMDLANEEELLAMLEEIVSKKQRQRELAQQRKNRLAEIANELSDEEFETLLSLVRPGN